ncbi:ATP-binding cassette domain-containing protein [Acinetobacter baumannii]|uniref:ATP-binding cassette domain-containing protein n=1 Tax=Acinetobacter baumannii TaxID=470 RepID=UPI001C0E653A|nr:ATP-binding cassette domain-containing protein [Acinetobacter baumannii]MBU3082361.1 ATP-binding cassette domain-containing protein [Acinetobacter baumannii]
MNIKARRGEIVGIAGLMGSGRTELAMSIFGKSYGKNIRGTVSIHGKQIDASTVRKAINNGLAYVTEDRKGYGLLLEESIKKNTSLANLSGISEHLVVNDHQETNIAKEFRNKLRIRSADVEQHTGNLSGGNQQKVVISKWLFTAPDVLILDEPTREVDVGAKYEIYTIIDQVAQEGKCIVMISSEMPELLGMCDRIYVMNEGKIVGEFLAKDASQEAIMRSIMKNGVN